MRKRFEAQLPKDGEGRGPYVVVAAVQTVLLIVLASIVTIPIVSLARRMVAAPEERVDQEQLSPPPPPLRRDSVASKGPPRQNEAPPTSSRAPAPPPPSEPPSVATPVVVPTTVPPPAVVPPGDTVQRLIGRGLIPELAPRPLLVIGERPPIPPTRLPRATGTPDSVMRTWVNEYWDSVARAQAIASEQRRPGDWTAERGGGKYGMDPQFIYFGKYKVPTMLLALLPINAQANPSRTERNRLLNQMREDIMYHAMRSQSEGAFNEAVKALRERKERERAAQRKDKQN